MTRRLALALLLLLVAPLSPSALDITPNDILSNPDRFDGKTVTLNGTITNLDARVSRKGNPYYTFDLAAGGRAIKVFSFGRPSCQNGTGVIVEGRFQAIKRVSGRTFVNEVEAVRVDCR